MAYKQYYAMEKINEIHISASVECIKKMFSQRNKPMGQGGIPALLQAFSEAESGMKVNGKSFIQGKYL